MATNKWAAPYRNQVGGGAFGTGGGGNVYDAISENADGTVPTETATTTNYAVNPFSAGNWALFEVVTPSIPANEALVGVYPYLQVVRADAGATSANYSGGIYFQSGGWYSVSTTTWTTIHSARTWKSGTVAWPYSVSPSAYSTNPGGAPTAQNSAVFFQDSVSVSANKTRFHEVGLVFQYRSIPTMSSFTATALSLATATFPTFTWSYADTDDGNSSQAGFLIKTYLTSSAPTTPTSGDGALHQEAVVSPDATYTIPSGTGFTPIPGTSYKTFIRTYKTVNGKEVYAAWTSATWTLSSVPPNPPTVTASYDSTDNEVDVTVATGHNLLSYQNSSGEDSGSTGDWASASNITAVTTQTTPTPPTDGGSRVYRFTPSGAVTILAICNQIISVAAGANYYLRADLRGTTAAETCRLGMRWYDSTGATVSTTYGTGSSHSTSAWTSFTATLAAPATAVTGSMVIEYQALSSTTDYQYADKIQVTASSQTWAPGTDGTATHTLQRSIDQSYWIDVPNGTVANPSWGLYYVKDIPPRGVTAYYRAKSTVRIGADYAAESAWSSSVSATTTSSGTWRLQRWDTRGCIKVVKKALTSNIATLTTETPHGFTVGERVAVFNVDATFNGAFTVTSTPLENTFTYAKTAGNVTETTAAGAVYAQVNLSNAKVTRHDTEVVESVGVFRPIGSTRPVVISGDLYGQDGSMSIMATSTSEWSSLEAVLQGQAPITLHDPWGGEWLIRVIDRSWRKSGTAAQPVWEAEATFVHVNEGTF